MAWSLCSQMFHPVFPAPQESISQVLGMPERLQQTSPWKLEGSSAAFI